MIAKSSFPSSGKAILRKGTPKGEGSFPQEKDGSSDLPKARPGKINYAIRQSITRLLYFGPN